MAEESDRIESRRLTRRIRIGHFVSERRPSRRGEAVFSPSQGNKGTERQAKPIEIRMRPGIGQWAERKIYFPLRSALRSKRRRKIDGFGRSLRPAWRTRPGAETIPENRG